MEGFLFPLSTAALMLPLAFMAWRPALAAWRRRHEARRVFKPRPAAKLVIPAADETAATIERFHAALRRSELSEFLRTR